MGYSENFIWGIILVIPMLGFLVIREWVKDTNSKIKQLQDDVKKLKEQR